MGLNNTAKHVMLDALDGDAPATDIDYISIHNDTPDSSGNAELTGGSPAYARKAVTWGAAASGAIAMTGTLVFDIPTGETVAAIGLWKGASGGTFLGYALVTNEVYAAQGTYTLLTLSIAVTG